VLLAYFLLRKFLVIIDVNAKPPLQVNFPQTVFFYAFNWKRFVDTKSLLASCSLHWASCTEIENISPPINEKPSFSGAQP
jgi:hypothetical protein